MGDHESRRRKKRKSQQKAENQRTDSESDKSNKDAQKDLKKNKSLKKHHIDENLGSDTEGSGGCVKCLFILLVTSLISGVIIVAMTLQVTDTTSIFTDEIIDKVSSILNDIKQDSSPVYEDNEPVISQPETWQDGNKIELSDSLDEKIINEDELQQTYGIHIGRSSEPMAMNEFPDEVETSDIGEHSNVEESQQNTVENPELSEIDQDKSKVDDTNDHSNDIEKDPLASDLNKEDIRDQSDNNLNVDKVVKETISDDSADAPDGNINDDVPHSEEFSDKLNESPENIVENNAKTSSHDEASPESNDLDMDFLFVDNTFDNKENNQPYNEEGVKMNSDILSEAEILYESSDKSGVNINDDVQVEPPNEEFIDKVNESPENIVENKAEASSIDEASSEPNNFGMDYLVVDNTFESSDTDDDSLLQSKTDSKNMYDKIDITSENDFAIKEDLDKADMELDQSPDQALSEFNRILKSHHKSARATFGLAVSLDKLASIHRSNTFLEQAIEKYQEVMNLKDTPNLLYTLSADRAFNRSLFRGHYNKALKIQSQHSQKFPQNMTIKNQIAVVLLMIGQNKESEKVLSQVLTEDPNNGFAKVHLGFIFKTVYSKYKEATKLMSEGIKTREPGTIDGRFFYHLGDAYYRLGFPSLAHQVYLDGANLGVFLSPMQRSLYNVNHLVSKPWWSFDNTKYDSSIKVLEGNWKIIREEAIALLNSENYFASENEGLQDSGNWKQFDLFARGHKNVANCKRASKTCSILSQIPDAAKCTRCQSKFSLMYPGTHVWPHTGPTNCRLRAHLGLVVPTGPKIRVDNETRTWKEGEVIIFDDSFEHEVWHSGDSYRLVLIIDFWHPQLTSYEKATLSPI